ncbi:guanine nucleotide-binding protein-like 1 isoform X2 [Gigantopelta aegis]|uniref:guanine nucleotide-binding protein-like 1 isoform X2 n=1 Tax=Gigantopelta aegis TaxID=1735272 RepID=UPI001B88D3C6|nr:guanine nucleotide-binding protein-like 1 isoform X2 [Gigantopelta aegis]
MPRKKPFSVKEKKKQLQERRHRKQDALYTNSDDDEYRDDDNKRPGTSESSEGDTNISQDIDSNLRKIQELKDLKHDPNRYRLLFLKETKEELEKRKELSRSPYKMLSETCLEVDIDDIYKPGTVLDIPKRPPWDTTITKHDLERQEEIYFKGYLEKIFEKYSLHDLSYFELNLETWRQLWRVTEMSDILLLITDIRHPALHFPPALYDHVTTELNKPMILILNKTDLVPPGLVIAWKHYFKHRFPKLHVVCFTSHTKQPTNDDRTSDVDVLHRKRRKGKRLPATGPRELYEACEQIVQGKVDLDKWKSLYDDSDEVDTNIDSGHVETESEVDTSFTHHAQYRDGVLTIGCVGYPNVGKSSMINGLVGRKVVSVSRTPGHTKHFQTIFLTPTVKLCDCPGLVFPSLVEKPLQILSGIYPIAQVREPYSAVLYLAERINLPKILKLQVPGSPKKSQVEDKYEWTAFGICEAWAIKNGFMTAKGGRPDVYRAANFILRLAVEGRLRLCFTPPEYVEKKRILAKSS